MCALQDESWVMVMTTSFAVAIEGLIFAEISCTCVICGNTSVFISSSYISYLGLVQKRLRYMYVGSANRPRGGHCVKSWVRVPVSTHISPYLCVEKWLASVNVRIY